MSFDKEQRDIHEECATEIHKLQTALKLVLSFYQAPYFTDEDVIYWAQQTGNSAVTTKVLCDHIRELLGEDEVRDQVHSNQSD
jgi:hypothetical protein